MKSFILKLTFLVISCFIIVCAMFFILANNIKNSIDWHLDQSKNILILGDSQTEVSINDTLISNSYNFSKSAEAYIYSYAKLRTITENNPHINTVLLSFSFGNIHPSSYDAKWLNRIGFKSLCDLCFIMKPSEILETISIKPDSSFIRLNECYLSLLKIHFIAKNKLSIHDLNIGKFQFLIRDKISVERQKLLNNNKRTIDYLTINQFQKKYLLKIIKHCHENNISLILINTPIYPLYLNKNMELKNLYYIFYNNELSHIKLLDYSNHTLEDSCYGDFNHLNHKGARIFSGIISKEMHQYSKH